MQTAATGLPTVTAAVLAAVRLMLMLTLMLRSMLMLTTPPMATERHLAASCVGADNRPTRTPSETNPEVRK